jgi:hypothetical protein
MLKSKLAFSDKFNQAKIEEIENMMKAINEKQDLQTDEYISLRQ